MSDTVALNGNSPAFRAHLETVSERWQAAMAFAGFDAAIVTAGEARLNFLDDQAPPLKLNPHFLQWCPSERAEGSALLIRPGDPAVLYFLRPEDYWHAPPELPDWAAGLEVKIFPDRRALLSELRRAALAVGNHVALLGDSGGDVLDGFPSQDVNPALLLNHLHYARAVKTPFELACMRAATARAVRGHLAARDSYRNGASEFHINLAYLAASGQLASELPYPNIVAQNGHAGILHYQHYDREAPAERRSFLIDAGGSAHGYAADITRTYAGPDDSSGGFAELIRRLDAAQQSLIGRISGPVDFLDLHVDMHHRLAEILSETGLARVTAEEIFTSGLTEVFLPHGLGHLIGLQTHDVGGQQAGPEGGLTPPPENYPTLRTTRRLDANMPVTIEPGLYFIPQLLEAARTGPHQRMLSWDAIDALAPCGGIRIEDNIVLGADGSVENLTRAAFAELSGEAAG